MTPPRVHREIVAAGVRFSYLERAAEGVGDKTPLVLLHGLVASGDCFAELIAELPRDRRLVALNLWASQSVDPAKELDVSFAGLTQVIAAFLEALELKPAILVGHSHGGALSLQIAVSYPETLRRMVLISPAHPFGGYDSRMIRFYLSGVGGLFARSLRWLPRWLHRWGQSRVMGPGKRLTLEQLEPYQRTFRAQHVIPRVLRLLRSWEADMQALREALERRAIEAPTLLVWGDRDTVVPFATAPALKRHLLWSELVTLRGVGHLPPEEAPRECGEAIASWLGRSETELV